MAKKKDIVRGLTLEELLTLSPVKLRSNHDEPTESYNKEENTVGKSEQLGSSYLFIQNHKGPSNSKPRDLNEGLKIIKDSKLDFKDVEMSGHFHKHTKKIKDLEV